MSHSTDAQPWPRPCGSASDVLFSQPLDLMQSYVNGWMFMSREYGRGRMPSPWRSGWNSAYGPMPRGWSGSSSAGSSSSVSAR